jgi:hypothetical protein
MNKKIFLSVFITFCFALFGGRLVQAQNITFQAFAPSAVVQGQQFQVQYVVSSDKAANLRVSPSLTENFDLLMGPTSMQSHEVRIINGKSTTSLLTTFTYVFAAKKEGTFNVEAATVQVGNSVYKSNAISIKVLPPDKAQAQGGQAQAQQGEASINSEGLFVRMIVAKNNVYEQEGFLVTFKLYTLYEIASVNNVKFPEFEGFMAQDIDLKGNQQWQPEHYNGRNYNAVTLKQSVLYPQRSGELKIGSAKVEVAVRVRNQSRGRGFFENFFDTYQTVHKEIGSQPATINVKPLPPGKPESFSGAVGSYTMTSDVSRTELKANEAVTIKLAIKGNGNIKLLKTPEIKFPNDFEIYDPKRDQKLNVSAAGASGTVNIEYMAIPRFAGDFEIPAVNFSYFDTKSASYKSLSTEAFKLHVEKGESSADPAVVSNFTNRESVKFFGKDIRYIKITKPHFLANKDIFFGSFTYIILYLTIALLFIIFFIIYRKQVRENANIALVRTKKANKTAVKRLKQADKLLKENKEELFYEEILRALWGYLSDKLSIPQSQLTRDNVAHELTKYGVDETLTSNFLEIINTCEFARYAPVKETGAMDKLFAETTDAIGNMETTIKK